MSNLNKYISDTHKISKHNLKKSKLANNREIYRNYSSNEEEEETIIKNNTNNSQNQTISYQKPIKKHYSYKLLTKCKKCIMNQICPVFEEQRNIVYQKTKNVINNKIKNVEKEYEFEPYEKERQIFDIQQNKEYYYKYIMSNMNIYKNKQCIFEKEIIEETYMEYDILKFPQIKSIIEQIITLKLEAFRLQKIKMVHGEAKTNSKGEIKLTPGLHYTIEIADKMAKLTKNVDEIINGIKTTNTNVTIDLSKSIMDSWEQRKLKMKTIKKLK